MPIASDAVGVAIAPNSKIALVFYNTAPVERGMKRKTGQICTLIVLGVTSPKMSRPLRINYPGAYYHVINRGAGIRDIFGRNDHRQMFLDLPHELHETFQVNIHAYCLMGNHYHLLLETLLGNLSRAMRHLNGVYT